MAKQTGNRVQSVEGAGEKTRSLKMWLPLKVITVQTEGRQGPYRAGTEAGCGAGAVPATSRLRLSL